jgi:benzodiazapine receptor
MMRPVSDWGGNIAAFVLVIAANAMANGVPINGQTTGEISAKYPSLFTPAGFTFSIWGLIYTLLIAFLIWQALPGQRSNKKIASISTLFVANCAANAAWIFVWHYDLLWLSLLLMACILLTLVQIYRRLDAAGPAASIAELILLRLPFSLYTGWITVATIANISCVQFAMGWDNAGLSQLDWTLLKLAIAGAIGATVIVRKGDIAYVLVIAWAAYGIASKQTGSPEIVGAAMVLSALAVLLATAAAIRRPRSV